VSEMPLFYGPQLKIERANEHIVTRFNLASRRSAPKTCLTDAFTAFDVHRSIPVLRSGVALYATSFTETMITSGSQTINTSQSSLPDSFPLGFAMLHKDKKVPRQSFATNSSEGVTSHQSGVRECYSSASRASSPSAR
jgi:hypothetical protein